jgi:hypothetical protein
MPCIIFIKKKKEKKNKKKKRWPRKVGRGQMGSFYKVRKKREGRSRKVEEKIKAVCRPSQVRQKQ